MRGTAAFWGLLIALVIGTGPLYGQFYYVYLKDKPCCEHPENDFAEKALERRLRHGIPFPKWEDLPLDTRYLTLLEQEVDSVRHPLRWLNAVSVKATEAQVRTLEEEEWVLRVEPMGEICSRLSGLEALPVATDSNKLDQLHRLQRKLMNLDSLAAHDLDGQGIRIAIFDAGFKGADKNPGLQHLFENKQILKTKDFYAGKEAVYRHNEHGTAVLSCIGGTYKGMPIGAAPKAEFLLARTEHGMFERYREEDAWLAAMEWADREGADIISSSLGYGKKRYTYEDMDGKTTKVTNAARMACRKGILVVNSAGNTGNEKFKYLTAPGDADSVLTVGASFPMVRYPMRFTAFGPSSDGKVKPDIAAPGYVVACNKKGWYDVFPGTSFSCPLVAGLAACLMQDSPDKTNMEIHRSIRNMGHLVPYYDYRMGFGVPNASLAFHERKEVKPTFEVMRRNDTTFVYFDPKVLKRGGKNRDINGKPFHYQYQKEDGTLSFSTTIRMRSDNQGVALPDAQRKPGRLRIWFEGYFWEEKTVD